MKTMTDFETALKQSCDRVEANLQKIIKALPCNKVNQAIEYSLTVGGKRLRPALVYQTAKLFDKDDENIDRIAVAIEMIHTYSLIHDDLPCMDDDDFRRGQPSCHKKFNEAVAVLAGDGLLNLAAEILLDGKYSQEYFNAIKFIFNCSGIGGMIGGQAVDIDENKVNDFETLDFLTENKTSKLISACVGAVCIYCNGSINQFEALQTFAENFGKAFQAADDLIDSDLDKNLSYTNLLGKEETKAKIEEYNFIAIESVKIFEHSEFFTELCKYNISRKI